MKQVPRKTVKLDDDVHRLLLQEKARTRVPIEVIIRDWVYLAAKMKRLLPADADKQS